MSDKGLEKMFGTYKDPKKKWRDQNKEHISDYNADYFQENKQEIYQQRAERRARKRARKEKSLFI